MAKKKKQEVTVKVDNAVDVRQFISQEFMDMTEEDMKLLDQRVEELEVEASQHMEKEQWLLNDAYLRDDVVHPVEGGESHED